MKKLLLSLSSVAVILTGCTLNNQVPKATIAYNPVTKQFNIASHKDVVMSNITVQVTGTNTSLQIGYYSANANVDVVKAAVIAQQQQIQATLQGLNQVLTAVSGVPIK